MRYWIAIYNDGTTYPDRDEARLMRQQYREIDREKLAAFEVWEDDKLILALNLEGNKRLIYRQRVQLIPGKGETRIWLVGWQETKNGVNFQSIAYIFPNGEILLSGDWNNTIALFQKPQILDFENWE